MLQDITNRKEATEAAMKTLPSYGRPQQPQVSLDNGLAASNVQPAIQDIDGNWMQNFDNGKYVSYNDQGGFTVTGNNPKDFFGYDEKYDGAFQTGAGQNMKFQGQ